VGELEKGSGRPKRPFRGIANLLRTGNLQGKTSYGAKIWPGLQQTAGRLHLRRGAKAKTQVALPMDVLQYKSLGSGFVKGEKESFSKRFAAPGSREAALTLYPFSPWASSPCS